VRQKLVELDRDVALEVSNTLALAVVVSECDLLGVLGRALAEKLAEKLRLRIFPPPIALPNVGVYLSWPAAARTTRGTAGSARGSLASSHGRGRAWPPDRGGRPARSTGERAAARKPALESAAPTTGENTT